MIGERVIPSEVGAIANFLRQNSFFSSIKNINLFAEKIYNVYHSRCDVLGELKKMDVWLVANPNRQKKNYARFIVNWLNRVRR